MFENRFFQQILRNALLPAIILPFAILSWLSAASSQVSKQTTVEQFYHGKTIDLIVGYPPGGANDGYARLVAHYIGKYIPGDPSVVLQNMPGAGSVTAANYIFNIAPKDGTVLGLLVPTLPLDERLGSSTARYRSSDFAWIGRVAPAPNITFMWYTSPIKTIKDAFGTPSTLGATGSSATNAIYPAILNSVLGTKFKMVMGYEGSGAAMIAMERGEIEGHSPTFDTLNSLHPDWITDKKVNIVVQYSLQRHTDLPDVPTAIELATTPSQRSILTFVSSASEIGKSIVSTPNIPSLRLEALRAAFDAMIKDPEFTSEAQSLRLEVDAMSGEELEKLVTNVHATPDNIIANVQKELPGTLTLRAAQLGLQSKGLFT